MASKTFGPESARRPHLVQDGKGGVAGEVGDLRADVERAITKLEARTGLLEIQWVDGGLVAVGGDHVVKGVGLLQAGVAAALTLFAGTSELVFEALTPGEGGNAFTVEIQDTGAISVTKTGDAFVITINLGVSTADAIATAVNADAAQSDGYLTCNGGGVGVAQAVTAATAMTGGVGDDWACEVAGEACLPANTTGANGGAAVTDTVATVTVPDLTGVGDPLAAGDVAVLAVLANGVRDAVSGVLA